MSVENKVVVDVKSELITELAMGVAKWRGVHRDTGNMEAQDAAVMYERMLCVVTTPAANVKM